MPDIEKVTKGLDCEEYSRCPECPYVKFGKCKVLLMRDVKELLEKQKDVYSKLEDSYSTLSNEYLSLANRAAHKPNIVRCKECVHRGDPKKCVLAFVAEKQDFPVSFYDNHGNWFCADGKPKESDPDD